MSEPLSWPCPCGTGLAYAACCARLHLGAAQAETAEELMRSRYSAYALGNDDHVFRTWHPRTRPERIDLEPATTWTGLRILDTEAGGVDDDSGVVEFAAGWTHNGVDGVLRERSRFERRAGRWVYVEGDVVRG